MADYPGSAFPDQHTTATYTSTTHQTTAAPAASCTIDKAYPCSLPGILRIVQIVLGFLYWTVVCSYGYYFQSYSFVIFTAVTAWVFTVILFCLHLFALTQRLTIIHWVFTELINNAAWSLLHFIAAIFISVVAGQRGGYIDTGKLVWGCLCGWVLFVLYGVSAFFNFREFMAMGGMSTVCGARNTTSTTTTTHTTTVIASGGGAGEIDEKSPPPPYPGGGPFE